MINTVLLLAIPIFVSSAPTDNSVVLDKYHSHDELVNTLKTLADKYDFVKKYDIGRSVEVFEFCHSVTHWTYRVSTKKFSSIFFKIRSKISQKNF